MSRNLLTTAAGFSGNGVFRIAINKTRIGGAEYLVSDSKTGCLRADLLDDAGNLRAERQRQGQG